MQKVPLNNDQPTNLREIALVVGKSTLVDRLAERLSACRLQSPPDEIKHLRAGFDSKAAVARRAFYNLGNYLLARRVRQVVESQTVVLDRCDTVYAVATRNADS